MNRKPKVLLTTNYGPNNITWGEDMYDLMTSRLARGHGPFQLSSHCHYFALYLIAENITNPTTVLENPHWDEFDRELDEGYEYVGFQIKSLHTPKIARMIKHVREKSPKTKIIVGGYGLLPLGQRLMPKEIPDSEYILENADYFCREEGVRFMRRLLDDGPIDREITQYRMPMTGFSLAGLEAQARIPVILVSLGCPNACDFCITSAFFNHRKFTVAEPEQVHRFIKNYQKRLKFKDIQVVLFDEDIFLNPDYVRELGRLLRSDKETWGVKWFGFGSMRSLSQFEPEEIRECGCGTIWIGVESFICGQDMTDDRYAKRQGKEIQEMFAGLQRHGVQTVGSLILGFDFHTRENLKEDIDRFVDLKPMFYQISPLGACPGTALHDRLLEEDRLYEDTQWEDAHLWKDATFKLKNFERNEIREFFDYAHEQIRDKLGPPPLQAMESALDSYLLLKDANDEYRSFLANRDRFMASGIFYYLRSVKLHHTSEKVRERARMLESRFLDEVGRAPIFSRIISRYVSRKIRKRSENPPPAVVSDPLPRWSYYQTFDDRVWVRKGRQAKKPVPYVDRRFVSRNRRFLRA